MARGHQLRRVALLVAALVAPVTALPAGPVKLGMLRVLVVDADGATVDGEVQVDGLLVGRTGAALRVPLSSTRLRVVVAGRAVEQPLALRDEFTTVALRLPRDAPAPAPDAAPAAPAAPAAAESPPAPPPATAVAPQRTLPTPPKLAVEAGIGAPMASGTATIHYHRADGQYGGWGLHAWESFNAPLDIAELNAGKLGSDRVLPGITWEQPLAPAGHDDFGVYWRVPASAFRNGRVNFIVHQGNAKELCGDDGFFLLQRTREAWVIADDCAVHLTHDDATSAAAAQK